MSVYFDKLGASRVYNIFHLNVFTNVGIVFVMYNAPLENIKFSLLLRSVAPTSIKITVTDTL